ncbi:MAG: hypothetical protein M3020_07560 [Myxococcota bacterium]|jgi:hypothetical protein|nr:hypothetical protein [Myxococcota bacterium]
MTEHGGYGMKVDGVVIVSPKPGVCTLVKYKDGPMQIATWKRIAEREPEMLWYRQAPSCMYEFWACQCSWTQAVARSIHQRRGAVKVAEKPKDLGMFRAPARCLAAHAERVNEFETAGV